MLYPYAKRFTNYPQALLGLTLAWGVGTGALMILGPSHNSLRGLLGDGALLVALVCLAGAYAAFTVFYDTIYAYQDVAFDSGAGIRSTAVAWRDRGRWVLGLCTVLQTALMLGVGYALGFGLAYLVICTITGVFQLRVVRIIQLESAEGCTSAFKYTVLSISGLMVLAMVVEWVSRDISEVGTVA